MENTTLDNVSKVLRSPNILLDTVKATIYAITSYRGATAEYLFAKAAKSQNASFKVGREAAISDCGLSLGDPLATFSREIGDNRVWIPEYGRMGRRVVGVDVKSITQYRDHTSVYNTAVQQDDNEAIYTPEYLGALTQHLSLTVGQKNSCFAIAIVSPANPLRVAIVPIHYLSLTAPSAEKEAARRQKYQFTAPVGFRLGPKLCGFAPLLVPFISPIDRMYPVLESIQASAMDQRTKM